METFKHNFKKETAVKDADGVNGFIQALTQVLYHIQEVTNFDPNKRFIDAVPLLDKIGNTTAELKPILEEAQAKLLSLRGSDMDDLRLSSKLS